MLFLVFSFLTTAVFAQEEELKQALKERYDGKIVVTVVPGLLAGEFKKGFMSIGQGDAGLLWYHYHDGVQIPDRKKGNPLKLWGKKTDEMDSLDARTFADLDSGLNVSALGKWEPLKVSKFYVNYGCSGCIVFSLVTTKLSHMRDMDMNKASTETTTRRSGGNTRQTVSVGEFGMRFQFFFDKDTVIKAGDTKTVIAEINKYLLPKEEAAAAMDAEKNIEIEIGLTEAQVIQKLGQPLKSIKVGAQKSLKFTDMTVTLTDGKVSEVKLN